MESGLFISEESTRDERGTNNGDLHAIEFRALNLVEDIHAVVQLLHEAWLFIHNEDRSELTIMTMRGVEHEMPAIEATLYWYLNEGYLAQVAIANGIFIGIVLYRKLFDDVTAIKLLYTTHSKISRNFVGSLNPHVIIYQTRKENPPDELFKMARNTIKLCETEKLITWSMTWENT